MSETLTATVLLAAGAALAGLVVGLIYLRLLRWTVDLYVAGRGRLMPAALTLARLAGAVTLLALLVRLGPAPLLGGLLGLLAARTIALRTVRSDR